LAHHGTAGNRVWPNQSVKRMPAKRMAWAVDVVEKSVNDELAADQPEGKARV
jgi:hypothetical protein